MSGLQAFSGLANAAVATGNQQSLLTALRTINMEIRTRRSELLELKKLRNMIRAQIPPDKSSEDETTHPQQLPANFVRGVSRTAWPGTSDRVFIPDLTNRPVWAQQCTLQNQHEHAVLWQSPGQNHAPKDATLQDCFFGAAQQNCIWCMRNTLIDGAQVNAMQETGWTTWDHVHYERKDHAVLEFLKDAGAKPSTRYLQFLESRT